MRNKYGCEIYESNRKTYYLGIRRNEKKIERKGSKNTLDILKDIFEGYYEKVEVKESKKMSVPLKEIWSSVKNTREYKKLPYKVKREYGRDYFYKWIENNYEACEEKAGGGKMVKGVREKKLDKNNIVN